MARAFAAEKKPVIAMGIEDIEPGKVYPPEIPRKAECTQALPDGTTCT